MSALAGRRALVTGSARNLGAEIAARLAAAGAAVAVNYRTSRADAEAVVAALEPPASGRHATIGGDVSDPDAAADVAVRAADSLGGPVDVLVNNAGPYAAEPFVELSEEDFDRIWNTNVKAAYLTAQAFTPGMRSNGWGRIVNISASSAFVRNRSVYTLANAALITLTEELAVELAPEITVNAIAPGQIHESLDELRSYVPEWADRVVAATPMGRLATRGEIADIVVVMCRPCFDAVTGITVPVDGGLRLGTF